MANEGSRTSGIFNADTLLDIGTNIVGEFFGGFARDVAKWGLDKWRDHKANKKYREHLVTLCGDADLDEGDLKGLLEEAKAYYEGNEQKRGSVRDLIMYSRGINFEAYLEPLETYRALPEEKRKAVVSVLTGARTAIYDWEWSRLDKETREQQSILIDGIRSMMQGLFKEFFQSDADMGGGKCLAPNLREIFIATKPMCPSCHRHTGLVPQPPAKIADGIFLRPQWICKDCGAEFPMEEYARKQSEEECEDNIARIVKETFQNVLEERDWTSAISRTKRFCERTFFSSDEHIGPAATLELLDAPQKIEDALDQLKNKLQNVDSAKKKGEDVEVLIENLREFAYAAYDWADWVYKGQMTGNCDFGEMYGVYLSVYSYLSLDDPTLPERNGAFLGFCLRYLRQEDAAAFLRFVKDLFRNGSLTEYERKRYQKLIRKKFGDTSYNADFRLEGDKLVAYSGREQDIEVPDEVRVIGEQAFLENARLRSVRLPVSVEVIGKGAFMGCESLEAVVFEDGCGVQRVDDFAFAGCGALKSIALPSLNSLGAWAFAGCAALGSFSIPRRLREFGAGAFAACTLKPVCADGSEYAEKGGCLFGDGGRKLLYVPADSTKIPFDDVTEIADGAAAYCPKLGEITLPKSLTKIGSFAFFCSASTDELSIGKHVTAVGRNAFGGSDIELLVSDKRAENWDPEWRGAKKKA